MAEVAGVLLSVTREEGRRMAKPCSGVQNRLCVKDDGVRDVQTKMDVLWVREPIHGLGGEVRILSATICL